MPKIGFSGLKSNYFSQILTLEGCVLTYTRNIKTTIKSTEKFST